MRDARRAIAIHTGFATAVDNGFLCLDHLRTVV